MKYLTNYVEEGQTRAFEKAGSFFAFSDKRFNEQKKEGVKYSHVGAGLICPKENVKSLMDELDKVGEAGIKQDIEENGLKAIIHRELGNHEYSYTYELEPTIMALQGYPITPELIKKEARQYLVDYYAWEDAEELKAQKAEATV